MSKAKLRTDFNNIQPAGKKQFERNHNETRRPGRPAGKRSNPAFRQYTVLLRRSTHDQAIAKLEKLKARPDFGEYVEALILEDCKRR